MRAFGSFLSGLIVGAAAGAIVALLYAPEKGEVLRKELKIKIDELEDELVDLQSKLKEKSGKVKEEVKKRISEIEEKIADLMKQYRKAQEE